LEFILNRAPLNRSRKIQIWQNQREILFRGLQYRNHLQSDWGLKILRKIIDMGLDEIRKVGSLFSNLPLIYKNLFLFNRYRKDALLLCQGQLIKVFCRMLQ
jgi:hypothetical protein